MNLFVSGASYSRSSKEPKYKVRVLFRRHTFPPVTPNISSLVVDTEKHIKWKTPDELLEVLKVRCLIRVRSHLVPPLLPDIR
ncbi:hypothetical protein RND71_009370 [Anisodus tanguticus]|uniref:Uncharacterized protein n=1 Tax=Anisodus tanguticus TaxID=243964 RepID=A0AAE1VRR7_9SOLA|nr:hypothetical protein RND71_009370 [Anisodus tanguticus]